jgi:hypothetical protein
MVPARSLLETSTVALGRVQTRAQFFFQIIKMGQNLKFEMNPLPWSKIIETFHKASYEDDEQLCQLGQLQIPIRIHVINFAQILI